ncbi:MAG TPA: FecR domain-containing protein, partial [Luteolibacter sp.]|nr:FecR domain-containing protein [Luteolibacter sp.]
MFDEERFKVLLGDYFDESLKGHDRVLFEEMLKTTAKARELFWEAAAHHALAREWALTSIGIDRAALIEGGEAAEGNIVDFKPERKSSLRFVVGGLAAAAALVMAFVFLNRTVAPKDVSGPAATAAETDTEASGGIAMIALSSEARWGLQEKGRLPKDELRPGPLRLMSGTIRIDFYSGTNLWVRGPAEIDLISQNEVRLESGDLFAVVPAAAIGFKVISGDASITDLGTQFGVRRKDGVDEIHVFEGRVAVKDGAASGSKVLTTGQAVRIEQGVWNARAADVSQFPDRNAIEQKLESERETRFSEWTHEAEKFTRRPDVLVHYLFDRKGRSGQIPNLVPDASGVTNGALIGGEWSTGRWEKKKALSFNGVG